MLDHLLYTRSPFVTTERVPVLVYVDVDGTGQRLPMEIEREVSWVAECTARTVFLHGGKELKVGATRVDHTYGFGSCLDSAIRDARLLCEDYSVDTESTMEVVVEATVTLTAVHPRAVSEERGIRSYREVPLDWIANREGAVQSFKDLWSGKHDAEVPPLVRRMKGDALPPEIIWTSKRGERENASLLASFRARAGIAA